MALEVQVLLDSEVTQDQQDPVEIQVSLGHQEVKDNLDKMVTKDLLGL